MPLIIFRRLEVGLSAGLRASPNVCGSPGAVNRLAVGIPLIIISPR